MAGKRGAPRKMGPKSGRRHFATRLHPDDIKTLRKAGGGWANRGIEYLVKRYQADLAQITE